MILNQKGYTLGQLINIIIIIVSTLIGVLILTGTLSFKTSNVPDMMNCNFVGLDPIGHSVFECPDGKLYTKAF